MIFYKKNQFEVLSAVDTIEGKLNTVVNNSFVWKIEWRCNGYVLILKWDAFAEVNCSCSANRALQL